ncbi:Bug family tripartite tricarboxylate transporter substrate binding protein, partial [Serratia marcescens]|uniref:Bug family tripartite tricarboxylate transporter substrate binding protein n=1 Tax=Serratia marcescens TaxID=615 RepID=UPI0020C616F3
ERTLPGISRRPFLQLAFGAATLPFASPGADAETIARPVTLIVPFSAGGPTDVLARILAEYMRGTLGHPVIVENVTGASGTVAGLRASRAAPDGSTI